MIKISEMMKQLFGSMSEEDKKKFNTISFPTGQSYNAETYKPARESMKKGGKVSSASKRADGIARRGRTKGRIV
jgi:predicted kinase